MNVVEVCAFNVRQLDREIETEFYGVDVSREKPLLILKTCHMLNIDLSGESRVLNSAPEIFS